MIVAPPNPPPPEPPQLLGPGLLVLVAGPSGAGKDSIIAAVQTRLADDRLVRFPRRTVTRPPSVDEDHDTLTESAFTDALAHGAFALYWTAHGLLYGLPRSIETEIAEGATVICNVSRATVGAARLRFSRVLWIEISAPRDVLRARLMARGRETPAEIDQRLARQVPRSAALQPDVVIENAGPLSTAVDQFLQQLAASRTR